MRNLRELQARKAELKANIERGIDNPLTSFWESIKKNNDQNRSVVEQPKGKRNKLVDEGVKTILSIIASSVVSRLKLGLFPKFAITAGVAIITPFIVDKTRNFIKKK